MTPQAFYEIIGYVASVLVAISLTMRSLLRLRLLNLLGAIFFTLYGLIIGAYPVAAVNGFIVIVDLYYLAQMLRTREYFSLLEMLPNSRFAQYFLNFHRAEIAQFFPDFVYEEQPDRLAFFVLRDMVPAGLFIARNRGDGTAEVLLDFVAPGYRDLQVARFVYVEHAHLFRERGIHYLEATTTHPQHMRYLERIGFRYVEDDAQGRKRYRLAIM